MWLLGPPAVSAIPAVSALAAVYVHTRMLRRRTTEERLRLRLQFPTRRRINLMIAFDGGEDEGPFAARAFLHGGPHLRLTRDSVDGLPDGADRREVVAPMTASPIGGDNFYRMVGVIGVESEVDDPAGRIHVEIFNRLGRALASRLIEF